MLDRLKCFFLKHDEVDICQGDSCWYCQRCGKTHHDARTPTHYARGGFLESGWTEVRLTRGTVLMSSASLAALGPSMVAKLFPDHDVIEYGA